MALLDAATFPSELRLKSGFFVTNLCKVNGMLNPNSAPLFFFFFWIVAGVTKKQQVL